jgi:DNA-binding MurR/RpiR family transcriptional regulator
LRRKAIGVSDAQPAEAFAARVTRLGRGLGSAGQRVTGFIMRNPAAAIAASAQELGAQAGTSDATVIRTVQTLGYAGFPEFKQALAAALDRPANPADDMRRTLEELNADAGEALAAVLAAHADAIRALRAPAFRQRLGAAASLLGGAARIVTFGVGPSAILAHYAAFMLARAGRRSRCLDATGIMLADQMLDLGAGDAVLAIAYGRPYREVTGLVAEARRLALPLVLISDTESGALAEAAALTVVIPRGKSRRVALHGATLVGLEALALALAAADRHAAIATLERLNALRAVVAGQRFDVG